jgi:hypothetical protein
VIAGCAVAVLALGVQAAGAWAAKPVLWLTNYAFERAAPGTAASALMQFENGCSTVTQQAKLATNGKPSDKLTLQSNASYSAACSGEKIAGSISGLTLKPQENGAAMTVKSTIHLFFEPWCVYAVPKTITMPAGGETYAEVTVSAPLEKRASFGACAPIRALPLTVVVNEAGINEPFFAEVVG